MKISTVGGGSINDSYRLSVADRSFFCKINSATKFPHLFVSEKNSLATLANAGVIQTPAVLDYFEAEGQQVLLLEWIEEGERTNTFWKKFGQQLAALHAISSSFHGLTENNYMGSVPQSNKPLNNWSQFFVAERLEPMIKRCLEKNQLTSVHRRQFESLQQKLPQIFTEEQPSLLHGDLWSGNFMCNRNAEPVLIDPAVYYGHRSMDLAMTTLFGGFRQPFYEAYHYHAPLPANHEEQWAICNLYPLLIHLYLFGSGYLSQVQQILKQFA